MWDEVKMLCFLLVFFQICWTSNQQEIDGLIKISNQAIINNMTIDEDITLIDSSPLERNKRQVIATIVTIGLGVLGTVSDLVGLFDFVTGKVENPEDEELHKLLNQIETRLNNVQHTLKDITNQISNEGMKTQYAQSEQIIWESLRKFKDYTATNSPGNLNKFLQTANKLETSIFTLYRGMMGEFALGSDILQISKSYMKNHRRMFVETSNSYLALVESGSATLVAIYELSDSYSEKDKQNLETQLIKKHDQVRKRIDSLALECGNREKVKEEMEHIMKIHAKLSNDEVANKLYYFLSDKYDTGYWFVTTYNGIEGVDKHWLQGWYYHVFRVGGKNAMAIFQAEPHYRSDVDQVNDKMKIITYVNERCRGICTTNKANVLVEYLVNDDKLGKLHCTFFAIKSYANVVRSINAKFDNHYYSTRIGDFIVTVVQHYNRVEPTTTTTTRKPTTTATTTTTTTPQTTTTTTTTTTTPTTTTTSKPITTTLKLPGCGNRWSFNFLLMFIACLVVSIFNPQRIN